MESSRGSQNAQTEKGDARNLVLDGLRHSGIVVHGSGSDFVEYSMPGFLADVDKYVQLISEQASSVDLYIDGDNVCLRAYYNSRQSGGMVGSGAATILKTGFSALSMFGSMAAGAGLACAAVLALMPSSESTDSRPPPPY